MPIRQNQTLDLVHSPDPDDAFAWWALATGRVTIPGVTVNVRHATMQQANLACAAGAIDVAAISSAAWPFFCGDYAALSTGASVGRGYGPALATRAGAPLDRSSRCRVAVPGNMTTGALLFRLLHPRCRTVEFPCSEVPAAILSGHVDGGVLIHEELLNWADRGLERAECLGERWTHATDLPIPVGLIVARRSLGTELLHELSLAVREAMEYALAHRADAMEYAMRTSHQTRAGIGERYIDMFANEDTMHLPEDCRRALAVLYGEAFDRGLIPRVPELDLVEPATSHRSAA